MEKSIHELVRTQKNSYLNDKVSISKYVQWSLYETIERIYAYINSKHISGDTDTLGREKVFFNIGTSAANIWYRATDIDRKDIRIKATKEADITRVFAANLHLQDFLRRDEFGIFLNNWGRTLSRFGSSVVKFVEKGDSLHACVVPWNNLIIDPVDFNASVQIEKIFATPSMLLSNDSYDKEKVKSLIKTLETRKTSDGQQMDLNAGFIEIYEVHGELPRSYITNNENDDKYAQQMHIIASIQTEKTGEYEDYTLFSGFEEKSPYMITHLIEEDGRVLGMGAYEHLFEAQWMVNHNMKAVKDHLDIANKLVFSTSDPGFLGQNVLNAVESGDILIHAPNSPLTQINNQSHDITQTQNYAHEWINLSQQITSTPDAISGNTMPSGTAYRQVAILNQESHSLFELMTENKGLYIEKMVRDYIIPFIKRKKLAHTKELIASLSDNGVEEIEKRFIKSTAAKIFNDRVKETILSGKLAENINLADIENEVKNKSIDIGKERYFKPSEIDDKTWKEYLKDLEWDVEVEITGESTDKQALLATYTTIFQTLAGNPGALDDPRLSKILNKIIEATGAMSPLELAIDTSANQTPQTNNTQAPGMNPSVSPSTNSMPTSMPTGAS